MEWRIHNHKFKYIYVSPDLSNVEFLENDLYLSYNSFIYYLNEWNECLCYHSASGPF